MTVQFIPATPLDHKKLKNQATIRKQALAQFRHILAQRWQ